VASFSLREFLDFPVGVEKGEDEGKGEGEGVVWWQVSEEE
jgi:hypothetical protein